MGKEAKKLFPFHDTEHPSRTSLSFYRTFYRTFYRPSSATLRKKMVGGLCTELVAPTTRLSSKEKVDDIGEGPGEGKRKL